MECFTCALYSSTNTPHPHCFDLEENEAKAYLKPCASGQVCQTMFTFQKEDSDKHFPEGFKGIFL